MKKKGFTLVELLAVIAILAILVLLALPNVLKTFNKAQKNSFETEAKNYYKAAEQKYLASQGQYYVFTNISDYTCTESAGCLKLAMDGNNEMDYFVKYIISGDEAKITYVLFANDDYYFSDTDTSNGVNIEEITDVDTQTKGSPKTIDCNTTYCYFQEGDQ